jgi:hypothetical protein
VFAGWGGDERLGKIMGKKNHRPRIFGEYEDGSSIVEK